MITIPHTPNLIIFNSSCCAATHEGGENSKGEDLHVSRKNLWRVLHSLTRTVSCRSILCPISSLLLVASPEPSPWD
jgi:hypothetical protein